VNNHTVTAVAATATAAANTAARTTIYCYYYCTLQALVEEEKTIKTDPSLDNEERAAKQQDLSERRMKVLFFSNVL
jgi:hypothetical protein